MKHRSHYEVRLKLRTGAAGLLVDEKRCGLCEEKEDLCGGLLRKVWLM